jgi:hypothetical protein
MEWLLSDSDRRARDKPPQVKQIVEFFGSGRKPFLREAVRDWA